MTTTFLKNVMSIAVIVTVILYLSFGFDVLRDLYLIAQHAVALSFVALFVVPWVWTLISLIKRLKTKGETV